MSLFGYIFKKFHKILQCIENKDVHICVHPITVSLDQANNEIMESPQSLNNRIIESPRSPDLLSTQRN